MNSLIETFLNITAAVALAVLVFIFWGAFGYVVWMLVERFT